MRRRTVAVAAVVLLVVGWAGYSAYVFNIEEFQSNQQTIVMADDAVEAGGAMAAHVVVTDRASGEPIANTDVDLYVVGEGERRQVANGTTGADGGFTTRVPAPNDTGDYRLAVETASDVATDTVGTNFTVTREYSLFVDTDKPVYQPGQEVHIRGLVKRRGGDPVANDTATVSVSGPRGNTLFERNVSLNAYGMGSIEFPVSSEGRTGRYRVSLSYGGEERTRTVTVKRYTLPQFDVQFDPDERYYQPGDTLTATVSSEYFFGEPVANATVEVTGEGYVGSLTPFANVTARTDERGIATVSMDLPKYFAGLPEKSGKGLVVLNVSVTDPAGHTETVTREVTVADQPVLLNAFTAGGGFASGVENALYVTAERPDGRPVATEVTVETANGTHTVETNAYGVGKLTFVPDPREDRQLTLRTEAPDSGERVTKRIHFEIERGTRIAMQVDRGAYDVGDTVRGQVFVGKESGYVYLDVVRDGQTLLTESVPVENGSARFSFEVGPSARGDLRIRAWAVFGNNRVGSTARRVLVRSGDDLSVRVEPGADIYRPGENATLTVETRRNGSHVPAAVGVDVVDESVFAVEERRAGLASLHFDLEEDLTQPRLFVHNYSLDRMREPPSSDDARLAEEAGVSRMRADAGGATVNSYDRKRQRIQQRKDHQRALNGWLFAGLLVVLPLGVVASGLRRHDTAEFLVDLGLSTGLVLAGAVLGIVLLVLVIAVGAGAGAALSAVLVIGLLVAAAVGAAKVDLGGPLSGFGRALAALLCLYVVVALVGVAASPYLDLAAPGAAVWTLAALSFMLFPVGVAALGDDLRKHVYKATVLGVLVSVVAAPAALFALGGAMLGGTGGAGMAAQGGGDAGGLEADVADESPTGAGGDGGGDDSPSGADGGDDGDTRVRQFFPETLDSRTVVTGPDGRASVDLRMADSITTWRISSFAVDGDGRVGSNRSSVRVFQPFFVKPDVPVALTQNDTVTIPVSVFNYENDTKQVRLKLEDREWYDADSTTATVLVPPETVRRAAFTITARQNGEFPLTITAVGEPGSDDGTVADANAADDRSVDVVRKTVTVEPHGQRRQIADSGAISGTERTSVDVPRSAVPGSEKTVLRVYPGAFGQVAGGMEALLEMPTGCFEQTSSSLYPNVLALQYMERTGQVNPELRMTAERFITTGYQRLLTFETSTRGGYSLFGGDPPNLLLTAYGLQEMSDMREVHTVDPQVIADMQSFLVDRQRADGSWSADGRLEYAIGVSGDELSTTAYVTWSLAKSDGDPAAVRDGADYVATTLDVESASTMTLAVALNALVAADSHAETQSAIADELERRAVTDGERVHWERGSGEGGDVNYGSKSVLTTATAVNGLLNSGRKPGLTRGGLTWIVEQKRGDGGWGGTQNTIMALQALVNARTTTGVAESGTLTVGHNGETVLEREINGTTRNEVATVVLPAEPGTNDYRLDGPEDSGLYYELTTEYHVPWDAVEDRPTGERPIAMDLTYNRTNLTVDDTLDARVNVTVSEGRVGMALVDLGVPPGFAVVESSLDRLRERGTISRYDVRGRQVTVYLEDVSDTRTFSVRMRATQPVEAASGDSRVYDYYNPEDESVEAPVLVHVRPGADGHGPDDDRTAAANGTDSTVAAENTTATADN